jgi:beta-phosphoglucomutase family hydrolase
MGRVRLGLPPDIEACLFDLDGVLTQTARLHAAAWKEMFDAFLAEQSKRADGSFVPFDLKRDYGEYIDGKLRYDGVRAFLASRGIRLPEGAPSDPPDANTVYGLGGRKDELVLGMIRNEGIETYDGSVRYVRAARDVGLRRAVVSASMHTRDMLDAGGIADLFEVRIDGVVAAQLHLSGKPAPDTFLAAAKALEVVPPQAAVFEDSLAGVAAGQAGGFGFVVGVDRLGHAAALRTHGADIVVNDLAELIE